MDSTVTVMTQVAIYIITALGGGSIITACIIKWAGKSLTDLIYKKIDSQFAKEIEAYKYELEQEKNKANALLTRIEHICISQYDREFEIYSNVWERLTNCRKLFDVLLLNYTGKPASDLASHRESIKKDLFAFGESVNLYQETVQNAAPFYQKNFFDAFVDLERLFFYQLKLMKRYEDSTFIPENEKKTIDRCIGEISSNSMQIQEDMRTYLQSLKIVG